MYFDNEYSKYRYAISETINRDVDRINRYIRETEKDIKQKSAKENWSYKKEDEEIKRRTKLYYNELQQLKNLSSAINNFEAELRSTGVIDNTEIETSLRTIEKTYEATGENNKDTQKLDQTYKKEKKEFDKELMKSIEEQRKKLLDLVDESYCKKMKVWVEGDQKKYGDIEYAVTHLTNLGCREAGINANYEHTEAVAPNFDTQYKIEELEEYEKLGGVSKTQTERLTFKTKLGFKPVKGVVSTKESLIKLSNSERRVKSIKNALYVMKKVGSNGLSQASHYPKTIEMLEKMLKEQEQKIATSRKDVNEKEIEKVEQSLKSNQIPESKDKLMASYADLYKKSLTVEINSEEYRRLNAEMEMIALTNGLSKDDIYKAKENGKKALEAEEEAKKKENDLLKNHEKDSLVDGEDMSKITADVEMQMRNEGYSEPDFEEEKQRRVTERLAQKDEVAQELLDEKKIKNAKINIAVDEYIKEQENYEGHSFGEQKKEDIHEHYDATMELTKEERAFETLKKDGLISKDAKLSELNAVERQVLEAQIRLEHNITDAIDKFNESKKEYEEYINNKRNGKLSNTNNQVEEVGKSR